MLFLRKIELKNFLSHADTVLEIKPDQKLLVDGVSGSGKSSVVDGLIWCLYGKARTTNRSLIKSGTSAASVTVVLEDDDKSYRVVRSISSKGKHDLEIFEKEPKAKTFKPSKVSGMKNLQDYLEKQVLRSSYLLFINSIVYPQENVENFVRQPATKRKDLILEIINAGDYDEMLDKSKKMLSEKKVTKEVTKSRKEEKNSLLSSLADMASKLKDYQDYDKVKKGEMLEVENELRETNEKLNEIKVRSIVHKDKIDRLEKAISEESFLFEKEELLNLKIGELKNLNLMELRSKVSALPGYKLELDKYYQQVVDYNNWNSQMMVIIKETPSSIDYDVQIDRLNKQIIAVMSEKIDLCPELNKSCPILVNKNQERITQMSSEVKRLKGEKEDLAKLNEAHEDKIKKLGEAPVIASSDATIAIKEKIVLAEAAKIELTGYEARLTQLPLITKELEEVSTRLKTYEAEIAKLTKELGESEDLSAQERNINMEMDQLMAKKNLLTMEINDTTANLTLALEASRKIERYKEDIDELSKSEEKIENEVDALETIKEALGPNGIRAIVIDLIIPQLEDKINNILSKLSEFRVKLDTQKSGVGDKVVLEGLFINIINDQGELFEFESYSGGERLKIIVAISEALSEVQKIGFRILDELFIGLDEESTEKFALVMTSLQEKFKQMICISHLRGIKDLFDEKVTVTKINGDSKIT